MVQKRNSNDRQVYFDHLKETSDLVRPIIDRVLEKLKERDQSLFEAAYSPFLRRYGTCGGLLQKPNIFRLSFEAAGGKDWLRFREPAAAFEVLNLATYLGNLGLDGKGYVTNTEERCNQFLAAVTCRESAANLVLSCSSFNSQEEALFILQRMTTVYSELHFGQYLDLSQFKLKSSPRYFNLRDYENKYLKRCRELSGFFNAAICEIGATLAEADEHAKRAFTEFGEFFGIGLQIVNDLADCTPSDWDEMLAKDYQGNFADLANGRIGLAIAHCLATSSRETAEAVMEKIGLESMTRHDKQWLAERIWHAGSVRYVYLIVKRQLRCAKNSLRVINRSEPRAQLGALASILCCNKYWHAWRNRFGALAPDQCEGELRNA